MLVLWTILAHWGNRRPPSWKQHLWKGLLTALLTAKTVSDRVNYKELREGHSGKNIFNHEGHLRTSHSWSFKVASREEIFFLIKNTPMFRLIYQMMWTPLSTHLTHLPHPWITASTSAFFPVLKHTGSFYPKSLIQGYLPKRSFPKRIFPYFTYIVSYYFV